MLRDGTVVDSQKLLNIEALEKAVFCRSELLTLSCGGRKTDALEFKGLLKKGLQN